MTDDILTLSFSAPAALVCAAARWFDDQKEAKNAIVLYSRAGRLNRALALCFAMKQYDALDEILDTLTSKTDPSVLVRCGRYFVESERWSKAPQCFALARQFDEVIALCNKHNIKLPSSVIQELSEMKADPEVMKRFASLCEQQGAFQTAATLYVKFKDHIAAMKALIRSGETAKVIKFANLVKKKETYILAGNYLQTLNPRDGDSTFEPVGMLYKKAGATDKLGWFYESVARNEIDEYQEYTKGLALMKAGLKLVEETPDVKQKEPVIAVMQKKIRLVEMYLEAQAAVKKDPKKTMVTAVEILRNPLVDAVMRTDDVYVLMVKASVAQGGTLRMLIRFWKT
jgi:intraflagellar transport protein 140